MSPHSPPDAQELSAIAVLAAQHGRDILTSGTGSRAALGKATPGDVVTEVDRHVEAGIRRLLGVLRPDDRIVGEELPDSGAGTSGIEWYVDPIDGTSNFVHGLDLYCTSVAAFDAVQRRWLAGAIAVPATGVTYAAAADHGATKTFSDGRVVVLGATSADGTPRLLGVGLSYDPDARRRQLHDIRTQMDDYDDMRSLGSAAYALCLVAEGALAAFVETDLFVYDWAAGALIAEEAGARVVRPGGMSRGAVSAHGRR